MPLKVRAGVGQGSRCDEEICRVWGLDGSNEIFQLSPHAARALTAADCKVPELSGASRIVWTD